MKECLSLEIIYIDYIKLKCYIYLASYFTDLYIKIVYIFLY